MDNEKCIVSGEVDRETAKAYHINAEIYTGRNRTWGFWLPKSRSEKVDGGLITECWLIEKKLEEASRDYMHNRQVAMAAKALDGSGIIMTEQWTASALY